MRLVRWLIAVLCLGAGAVVGALNPQPVSLDLGFSILRATLGVCVLASLLAGVVLGGLVASIVRPIRRHANRLDANPSATRGGQA